MLAGDGGRDAALGAERTCPGGPDWLLTIAEPDWFRYYATRAEDSRFPKARTKRDEVGQRIGRDGMRLLEAVSSPRAPAGVREIEEVQVLRQVWVQHFHLVEGGVRRRDPKDRPPGATRLVTPYDIEAQTPRARTRTSHFAALRPAEPKLGGAK